MKTIDINRVNADRFWSKVDKSGECWVWTAAKIPPGYGTFTVDNRTYSATHIALTLSGRPRPAPPNNFALHGECTNPSCVNPAHLRWGSQRENVADQYRFGHIDRKGERGHSVKLTEADVRAIRTRPEPSTKLAPVYGVTPAQIRNIRRRITWAHVT